MGTTAVVLIVVGVIFALLILMMIGIDKKLVALRNRHKNAFSQINVQLKRRHDLIPNLVEVDKG
jgi:LemA protein